MLLRIAWRNLWRNRRRTLITLVSIAFGFLLAVSFTAISDGYYGQLIDSAASMGSGNVTIEPHGYRGKPGAGLVISQAPALAHKVRSITGVNAATLRIMGQGMVATAADSSGIGIIGINPADERDRLLVLRHIKTGATLPSAQGGKVLVGNLMARQLELGIGKKLVLTTTDRHGNVVTGLLKVCGIFSSGVDEVDRYVIIVPIDYLRTLIGYAPDEATQVAIFLQDFLNTPAMSSALSGLARAHGGVALPWTEVMSDVAGVITMDKVGNYFLQVFVFMVVGAGILNTMLMGVMERMREFGVMIAVGMSPRKIWSLIMLEAFWLAVVGILVGIVVSIPVYWYLYAYGIDLSQMMSEKQVAGGVLFELFIKARFRFDHAMIIFGGVFAMILASGIYPAFLAARTSPIETMKTI